MADFQYLRERLREINKQEQRRAREEQAFRRRHCATPAEERVDADPRPVGFILALIGGVTVLAFAAWLLSGRR